MGIFQFIFELIFGQFGKGKKKKSRRQRKKDKKALLRARNRRLHRIFMMRSKALQDREKPLTVETLIARSIRKGKKRSKMKWQHKVQHLSHTVRNKDVEQRKESLRARVKAKREKAQSLWMGAGSS